MKLERTEFVTKIKNGDAAAALRRFILRPSFFIVLVIPLFASCVVYPVRQDVTLPLTVPDSFENAGTVKASERWWEDFDDRALSALIDEALDENLDLRSAAARLEQSRAIARMSGADKQPSLSLSSGISRSRSDTGPIESTDNRFSIDLSAAYEIDLWQRIESSQTAAVLDAAARVEDLDALALLVTSDIANAWYAIVERRAQLKLLQEQLEVNKTYLDLVELRFGTGQSTAVAVYQQREQVAATETQIPTVESQLRVQLHRLSVLLGRDPADRVAFGLSELPELSALPDPGLPAELLQRRPDVRAAQTRIMAADYRIAAAIAERYPTLRLTASRGNQSGDIEDLFSNWLWSLAGGLTAPLIDGERRAAEVDRTRAVLEEALSGYEATVLDALQDVNNALVQERYQHEYIANLERQLDFAQTALRESQKRYAAGSVRLPRRLDGTACRAANRAHAHHSEQRLNSLSHRASQGDGGKFECGRGNAESGINSWQFRNRQFV